MKKDVEPHDAEVMLIGAAIAAFQSMPAKAKAAVLAMIAVMAVYSAYRVGMNAA